jgi:hypothetical protein
VFGDKLKIHLNIDAMSDIVLQDEIEIAITAINDGIQKIILSTGNHIRTLNVVNLDDGKKIPKKPKIPKDSVEVGSFKTYSSRLCKVLKTLAEVSDAIYCRYDPSTDKLVLTAASPDRKQIHQYLVEVDSDVGV